MIHLSPQADVNLKLILQELTPRLSDSVKLCACSFFASCVTRYGGPESVSQSSVQSNHKVIAHDPRAMARGISNHQIASHQNGDLGRESAPSKEAGQDL
jgi:hypothetical protein